MRTYAKATGLIAMLAVSGCASIVGAEFDGVHPLDDAGDESSDAPDVVNEAGDERHDDAKQDVSAETGPSSTDDAADAGDGGDGAEARDVSDAGHTGDVGTDVLDASRERPDAPCALFESCGTYPWPGGSEPFNGFHVHVPYDLDPNLTPTQRDQVMTGMQAWTNATKQTILFQPATANDGKFVRFVKSGTCGHAHLSDAVVAFQAADCGDAGNLLHELGLLLGLAPTQQRYDRDRYLALDDDIFLECTGPDARAQQIAPKCDPLVGPAGDFGVFNFQSIMMSSGFSEAGKTSQCGTPPAGDRTFVRRGISDTAGQACKSDVEANWNGNRVTVGDGSSAIQLYLAAWAGWMQFQSLSRDVGSHAPLDVQLSPGVTIDGNPAVASLGAANIRIFVRGSDGKIWDGTGGPTAWESLGSPPSQGQPSEPAAVSWTQDANRIDMVTVANQTVYHRPFDGKWEDWDASIGAPTGGARSAASIASGGAGTLYVYVVGMDGQIWTNEWNGSGWTSWSALPLLPTGIRAVNSPASTARSTLSKHVMVRGTDDALYYISASPTWSSAWVQAARPGTAGVGRPSFATLGPSILFAVVRGSEGFVWQVACQGPSCDSAGAWEPPIPLGGVLVGDPAISGLRGNTRVDLVITSADGAAFPVPSAAVGLWRSFWPRNFQ